MVNQKTVFVGLSGGVDSSVAALRLQKQGYRVVGVFIKVWHPEFMVCNWEQERLDAMRVAAHLNIPFLTCDAEAEYRDEVAAHFIAEYRAGRTPNPDVMCNQHVKFGAFLRFAQARGADYIATGHYARKIEGADGPELHRGVDQNKDQTYFLWSLTNEQLAATLFPVGDTPKEKIRQEAEAAGIPTAQKKDSQGICFLGQVDIPEFLSHYVTLSQGDVINAKGEKIGVHKGALVYTLGQRHGFTLATHDAERSAMYVVDRDIEANTITVAAARPEQEALSSIRLSQVVIRADMHTQETLEAQFRYRQPPFIATAKNTDGEQIELLPHTTIERPAAGQSCVLYRGTVCIGGGIVA